MRHIVTTFDKCIPPLPLMSIEVENGKANFHKFYLPGTGLSLRQINENIVAFKPKLMSGCINNYKDHVIPFGLSEMPNGVFDLRVKPNNDNIKLSLAKAAKESLSISPAPWHELLAKASLVYSKLEERGYKINYKKLDVKYDLDVFSGRSKTLGFNLQGATQEYDISSTIWPYQYFVYFDWIAADLRMASFISKDEIMENSFIESDPYNSIVQHLNDPEFTRDIVKGHVLREFYSLSVDSPIFDMFPTFRSWMKERINFMKKNGYLETIMGRRFYVNNNELAVFNSQFQGSVAHAMQASLVKIWELFPDNLFAEIHDSVVLCCNKSQLNEIITEVSRIMLNPLHGWVNDSPMMPLKISIGNKWRAWKFVKRVNKYE